MIHAGSTRARTRRGPPIQESGPSASDDAWRGGGTSCLGRRGFGFLNLPLLTLRAAGSPTFLSLASRFLGG